MAWGAVHNITHLFFGDSPAPACHSIHPFPEWRRYFRLHRLPSCQRYRIPRVRRETEKALPGLRLQFGWNVRGFLLINYDWTDAPPFFLFLWPPQ